MDMTDFDPGRHALAKWNWICDTALSIADELNAIEDNGEKRDRFIAELEAHPFTEEHAS